MTEQQKQSAAAEAQQDTEFPPSEATAEETPDGGVSRDDAIRQADAKAASTLRQKYRDEFNALKTKHAADLGFDWKPKPTKEDKDREAFERLLAEHPEFRASLGGGGDESQPGRTV